MSNRRAATRDDSKNLDRYTFCALSTTRRRHGHVARHNRRSELVSFHLGDTRKAILATSGHALVVGGPGSGKTTMALLAAQARSSTLKPGQEILFLSFSRAAI